MRLKRQMESFKNTIRGVRQGAPKDLPSMLVLFGETSPAELAVALHPNMTGEKISVLQSEMASLQFLVDRGNKVANRVNQEVGRRRAALDAKRRELDRLQNHPLNWDRVKNVRFGDYTCPGAPALLPVEYHHVCFRDAERRLQRMEQSWLMGYPVSFCYPRTVAHFYHQKFANISRPERMTDGRHSHWVNGRKVYDTANEGKYLAQYARAQCVRTTRKAGWDCLRHLEIMATGAIPVYQRQGAEPIDELTMYHHPKECFDEFDRAAGAPQEQVDRLREDLWKYFTRHLTCDAELQFVMRAVDYDPCRDVPALYLDSYLAKDIDYQSNSFFDGLRDLLGPNLDVWQEPHYLYNNWNGEQHTLYGNGLGYALAIDSRLHSNGVPDHVVLDRVRKGYYKLVIYGSITRSLPFWNEVSAALPPDRIWAVDGEDVPPGNEMFFREGKHHRSTVFVREMRQAMFNCPLPPIPPTWRPACLPDAAKAPLPPEPRLQCLRQAEARIAAFTAVKSVFPISFCLTRPRLAEWDALRSRRPKEDGRLFGNRFAETAGDRDALAASEYATLQGGPPWGGALLADMFGAGVLPLWEGPWIPRRFTLFHYPKECFGPYRTARRDAPLRAALRAGTRTFVQNHLTCGSMAQFMLRSVDYDPCPAHPALFINEQSSGDAALLADMVLAGMREVLGTRLDVWNATGAADPAVAQRLTAKHYRLVVYGSFSRSSTLLQEARGALPTNRILAVVADPNVLQDPPAAGATLFTREATLPRSPARR
eukprot:EG_transcript_3261